MYRALFGVLAMVFGIAAIQLAPNEIAASVLMVVVFLAPIIGFITNDESLSLWEMFSIVGGFLGVILMTNSGMMKHEKELNTFVKIERKDYPYMNLGCFCAFLFAIFMSLTYLKLKQIGNPVHSSIKTFYFAVLQLISALIYIAFVDRRIFEVQNIGTDKYPIGLN